MKILIASDVYGNQICGVTNSIEALRDELIRLGHDVRMLVLSPNRKSFVNKNEYYIGSLPMPVYPSARISLKKHDKLIKEIINWKPDIVHIQTEFSSRILANRIIRKLNIPFVITCHGMYEEYIKYIHIPRTIGRPIIKRLSNKYYNPSSAVIVPSNKMKEKLMEYKIKCPIEVIPTGINLSNYQKKLSQEEKNKILSSLHLKNNDKYIVTVSRLGAEKNIDELIEYLPELIEKDKEIKFIIVGDGPYKNELKEKAKKLSVTDNVIFTGMIKPTEVYKYYQLGNIFVSASTSETQGLIFVEALACGMPMVCRKDKCLEEVIENGVNGFIFENKDEFIEQILSIINNKDLAEKMGQISYKKSNNFSKEEFGIRMEKLYKKILEGNKYE
ncbi:MAG: glycosyltransferase family 4 protein [Clostridia bacterium]|nr:glycosyltransferase family 4 protein [Clostridia bacterium]